MTPEAMLRELRRELRVGLIKAPTRGYLLLVYDRHQVEIYRSLNAAACVAEAFGDLVPTSVCPFCGAVVHGLSQEVAHMQGEHPGIVERRLRVAGFVRIADRWIDTQGGNDD